jgi:hypothetical protein
MKIEQAYEKLKQCYPRVGDESVPAVMEAALVLPDRECRMLLMAALLTFNAHGDKLRAALDVIRACLEKAKREGGK